MGRYSLVVDTGTLYEIIGYLGSAFIIASILQRSIFRLRMFGMAGGIVFLIYSLLIDAYPIAIVNVIATGIHVYYLRELLLRPDETFSILHVNSDSGYVQYFLDFHAKEIDRFFEGLPERTDDLIMVFVLRDLIPAGLYIGRQSGDCVETMMDYAIPQYRDLKLGRYLYSHRHEVFADRGVRRIVSRTESAEHAAYLLKMGFLEQDGAFVLDLDDRR